MTVNNTRDIKRAAKFAKDAVLSKLCDQIAKARQNAHNNKIPYGFVAKQVKDMRHFCPWLTRDAVMNAHRKREATARKFQSRDSAQAGVDGNTTPPVGVIVPIAHKDSSGCRALVAYNPPKSGRPKGATNKRKRLQAISLVATKNEIVATFDKEKQKCVRAKKRMKKGFLQSLINTIVLRNNLPADSIKSDMVRQRIKNDRKFTTVAQGHSPPLAAIEPKIVNTVIQLARIRQSITPTQGQRLVNSIIEGTPAQNNLVAWKKKIGFNGELGQVGAGFWRGFMRRNKDKIVSRKGKKYELDRASWSTYANFAQMYDGVIIELVDANVAVERVTPSWMDRDGFECEEKDAFGCMVTHDITDPDMVLTLDEVGGNTSQKGDGQIGGELMLCATGTTPSRKINTKDKHYTVIPITTLSGKPVMCCIIFSGLRENHLCETGLDLTKPFIGSVDDSDFVQKNSGEGKVFPGGPTTQFKGKTIPCFCRWSEKGSVTTEILRDILATFDTLKVFDRSKGKTPCVLLDGHGSRFGLPFLEYITDALHPWCVVIGVPYGTAIWQVGDSAEQNGTLNMSSVREKRRIVEEKEKMFLPPTIEATDILKIVTQGYKDGFCNEKNNKRAISERGWFPFSRHLLTYPTLRATMTEDEKEKEGLASSNIHLPSNTKFLSTDLVMEPTFNPEYAIVPYTSEQQVVNFSQGTAAFCLDKIVQHADVQAARERIKTNHQEGKSFQDKLRTIKTMTAGQLFKAKGCRIGKDIMDIYNENIAAVAEEKVTKRRKNREDYIAMQHAANELMRTTPVDITKMSNKNLLVLLKPLKRKDDGPMPTKKQAMLQKYNEWKHRPPLTFDDNINDEIELQTVVPMHDTTVDSTTDTTDEAASNEDDTAAVAQMMLEMGQVVDV